MLKKNSCLLYYRKTDRGFGIASWYDIYGCPCDLQESSLAHLEQPGASAVGLGIEHHRMHLDRKQVKMLIGMLMEWLDSGSVQDPDE